MIGRRQTQMPYKYGEDQDLYEREASDGGVTTPLADGEAPTESQGQPYGDVDTSRMRPLDQGYGDAESSRVRPLPESSPRRRGGLVRRPQPVETFAEMQARGQARPPAPTPMGDGGIGGAGGYWETGGGTPATADGGIGDRATLSGARVPLMPTDFGRPAIGGRGSTNELLETLLTGIRRQGQSSSPYDSDAVRSEYDWMAGQIDDDYAMAERATDEGMARRGLYGSAGKDFHSGRLSDLNVGKRSAKTSLAQDLATKYATTAGQYEAQNENRVLDYIAALMGFGQQAFNNDMTTAQFDRLQNLDQQDLERWLLMMGYGG